MNTKQFLKLWIANNSPQAIEKLAVKTGISCSLIRKILRGHTPKSALVRRALSASLEIEEILLFPKSLKKSA